MMAAMALDGEVRKSLLDRTDAEKVFRPWWDTLEDTLLNTLIALGETDIDDFQNDTPIYVHLVFGFDEPFQSKQAKQLQ